MPLLSIQDLDVTYHNAGKRVKAVRHVSLDLEQQDFVGVVGESGSGKSTLITALLRLLPGDVEVAGKIFFEGRDLLALTAEEMNALRWKEISVVFQKSMNALSPVHRIGSQMSDIYHVHEPSATKKETKARMLELLGMVNLPERIYRAYAHELSGGMMQRVSIALSLMHNPKLLVLDEATTALDVITQGQILDNIRELQRKLRLTCLMITHDMSVVASTCKRIVVMYGGSLMETGTVKDVINDPRHPYTQGLLASFPSLSQNKKSISGIPGSIPDLSVVVPGCIFAPRCPFAKEICTKVDPETTALGNGRTVRCHLCRKEGIRNGIGD